MSRREITVVVSCAAQSNQLDVLFHQLFDARRIQFVIDEDTHGFCTGHGRGRDRVERKFQESPINLRRAIAPERYSRS